jgi:hypothetical protein
MAFAATEVMRAKPLFASFAKRLEVPVPPILIHAPTTKAGTLVKVINVLVMPWAVQTRSPETAWMPTAFMRTPAPPAGDEGSRA